ncbi:hypothetical protein [Methylogaea oryzae]|uniref:Uncharacterized protein n=1 Tax=Methylogaea oryzae TaxID=1295382 RepID=A0A8D4VRF2_9GAMM|nr:hypothetical protein [Methylogaea oryzae]BBL72755.1 hypothetical protein MoryE10_33610 [Methylogaea oryzae]
MSKLLTITLSAVLAPVILAAPAFAGDDPKHPAYDFQPTILQKADPSAASSSSASSSSSDSAQASEADPKYPGAYFTPKVLYP